MTKVVLYRNSWTMNGYVNICMIEAKWIILIVLGSNEFMLSVRVDESTYSSSRRIHMNCKKFIWSNSIERCSYFNFTSKLKPLFIAKLFFMIMSRLGRASPYPPYWPFNYENDFSTHSNMNPFTILSCLFLIQTTPHIYIARSSQYLSLAKYYLPAIPPNPICLPVIPFSSSSSFHHS